MQLRFHALFHARVHAQKNIWIGTGQQEMLSGLEARFEHQGPPGLEFTIPRYVRCWRGVGSSAWLGGNLNLLDGVSWECSVYFKRQSERLETLSPRVLRTMNEKGVLSLEQKLEDIAKHVFSRN